MKVFSYLRIIILIVLVLIGYLWWMGRTSVINYHFSYKNNEHGSENLHQNEKERDNNIVVVVVVCGDRLQESLNMLKSALMFTRMHLNFIIITENRLILDFEEKLSEWKIVSQNKFSYKLMHLTFPKDDSNEWRRLFKPCASQRLFLPSILPEVDSVLYVDTDTLFLTAVENVWDHFYKMNSSQMAALAPEHEDPNVGWYNRFARHPFYGPLGVNSGVMLMNLTKMREFKWADYVVPIYKKYKLKITWGDQDIINIIFHYHPDKLYIYPCQYNYRSDHCMYMSVCKSAEESGVSVLHGSRGFFHSTKQPVFQMIYKAFEEYQLGNDLYQEFYLPLESYLDTTSESNCGHIKNVFTKNVEKYLYFKSIDNTR